MNRNDFCVSFVRDKFFSTEAKNSSSLAIVKALISPKCGLYRASHENQSSLILNYIIRWFIGSSLLNISKCLPDIFESNFGRSYLVNDVYEEWEKTPVSVEMWCIHRLMRYKWGFHSLSYLHRGWPFSCTRTCNDNCIESAHMVKKLHKIPPINISTFPFYASIPIAGKNTSVPWHESLLAFNGARASFDQRWTASFQAGCIYGALKYFSFTTPKILYFWEVFTFVQPILKITGIQKWNHVLATLLNVTDFWSYENCARTLKLFFRFQFKCTKTKFSCDFPRKCFI